MDAPTEMRTMAYHSRSAAEANAWQQALREKLWPILQLDDLVAPGGRAPLMPTVTSTLDKGTHVFQEIELQVTANRRAKVVVTLPESGDAPCPAAVCLHGHGHDRFEVYDPESIYAGFATALTDRGFVTIATDVGQHDVYEADRTLMGERLWDVIRCVDYLETLPQVDTTRIGVAGLSLGGEMALWLGAMDERLQVSLVSGFTSRMDQMEQNHCMCWKFPGLRELVDFADLHALIAPRAQLCQNGLQELPVHFPVSIAEEVLAEFKVIYEDMGCPENVELAVHDGGHVIDLPSLLAFFERLS